MTYIDPSVLSRLEINFETQALQNPFETLYLLNFTTCEPV